MKTPLLYFLLLLTSSPVLLAQAFQCDKRFYIVGRNNSGSFLEACTLSLEGEIQKERIELSAPERQYTCLGLSIDDMHLYALDFNSKELLRINANGAVENLGVPENLNTELEYWAGTVSPSGRTLTVIGYSKVEQKDKVVYSISLLREDYYAGIISIVSTFPTALADLALDPTRGVLYGFDKQQQQIIVIGTNTITHHQHKKVTAYAEGLFFDEFGQLYAYGGGGVSEQTALYKVDKISGEFERIANLTQGRFGDACSCPYRLKFERTVTPEVLVPCEEFTIQYTILNTAGEGKTGVLLEDILPESVVITEVVEHTFTLATIESDVGTSLFYIPNLDVLLNKNTITLKAKLIDERSDQLETQASLEGLALGLGNSRLSDNPFTSTVADANINTIADNEQFDLADFLTYNCDGETALLSLPISSARILWNTGETTSSIVVRESGIYSVEVENECLFLRDTITVDAFPERLTLDLGVDLQVAQGKAFQLAFNTNSTDLQSINWRSENVFELNCDDCSFPLLTPLRDNIYFLAITNEKGCSAEDSIRIVVETTESIYVPTAFSPDGDGQNDVFYLQGIEGVAAILTFSIFDRWGNVLYQVQNLPINDATFGWDGKSRTTDAVNGSYVWVAEIEFVEGERKQLQGLVQLVRR